MKRLACSSTSLALAAISVCGIAGPAVAAPDLRATVEIVPAGRLITPGSSIETPADIGTRGHTNIHIFQAAGSISPANSAPSGYSENPYSLACVYKLVIQVTGCNPETLTKHAAGGSKVIAIVDAYDDPTAAADLAVFSKYYKLPAVTSSNFQVVYASGSQPAQDSTGGWELEESLDIEMAHALAPKAKVILVEATNNSFLNLFQAEQVASGLVSAAGGGEVSNSWGGSEFDGEEDYETYFQASNVVFFASAGDQPGVELPSIFSNVVGVGGTTINRDSNGNYLGQSVWSGTGGGESRYVPVPTYQKKVSKIVGTLRGAPDTALVAGSGSTVWIYDSTAYNGTVLDWTTVYGTSVASPTIAAIVNNAGHFYASSDAELTKIYANLGNAANYTDITTGTCDNGSTNLVGWDYCTGIGTPFGKAGK